MAPRALGRSVLSLHICVRALLAFQSVVCHSQQLMMMLIKSLPEQSLSPAYQKQYIYSFITTKYTSISDTWRRNFHELIIQFSFLWIIITMIRSWKVIKQRPWCPPMSFPKSRVTSVSLDNWNSSILVIGDTWRWQLNIPSQPHTVFSHQSPSLMLCFPSAFDTQQCSWDLK